MIHEIEKVLMFDTPKGKAIAHFILDYGSEADLIWVCFLQETGECWCFSNKEIRIENNATLGRVKPILQRIKE